MLLAKIGTGAAVGAAVLLGATSAFAAGSWSVVAAPPSGQNGLLTGVSATSDTDAWAVGSSNAAATGLGAKPVMDHWDGSAWSQVSTPATGYNTNSLAAVSASSATDAWAVGRSQPSRYTFYPMAMHWNGSAWSVAPSFAGALAGQIGVGVTDISPTDAYAIGGHLGSAPAGRVAQWNGTTWSNVSVPLPDNNNLASDLYAISSDGPNDVWIVGTYELQVSASDLATETYSLHWNGSAWSIVSMPPAPGTDPNFHYLLNGIHANSPTDVWAVGESVNAAVSGSAQTLIEHWNGTRWSIVPSPSPGTGAVLTGVTSGWAVGYDTASTGQVQTLTLNWNGTAWTTVPSPGASVLLSVAATPGSSTVHAVGYSGTSGALNPFALRNS